MKHVILAAINPYKDEVMINASLEELEALCNANGLEVVGTITQKMHTSNRVMYFNRGKLDELKLMIEASGADTVVFDDELSGSQQKNISSILGMDVFDRTFLILEIFASRAKTREAKLQVEIAKLRYEMPRLVGQYESLYAEQGGGDVLRGSGETALEIQKRNLRATMARLENELEDMSDIRRQQRAKRDKNQLYKVALVGYTNAGKSTILNGMMDEDSEKKVLAQNMLFATLETSTRRIESKNKPPFLLTDTVGFVSKLPHSLVKAFRSTLEEVLEADLLLHVIDASNPEYRLQTKVTNEVLEELGAKDMPMIYVYNKMDRKLEDLEQQTPCLDISAKRLEDMERLKATIYDELFASFEVVTLLLPYAQMQHYEYIKLNGEILETLQGDSGTYLTTRLSAGDVEKFKHFIVDEEEQ
ncbi:MAG: GTPase HflX [Erysipelotrichaceae bacterium]